MKCWGHKHAIGFNYVASNGLGDSQLELGDNLPYFNPGTGLSITKVGCSNGSTCIILNTGEIKCTGYNDFGQCGIGFPSNSTVPYIGEITGHIGDNLPIVNLGNNVQAAQVIGGFQFTCVLTTDGKVKCFGRNDTGQLGLGNNLPKGLSSSHMGDNLPFVNLGVGALATSIHIGPYSTHSCAILSAPTASAQRVKCWGSNDIYQLGYARVVLGHRGDGANEMGDFLPLVDFGSESRVKQISTGPGFACAVLINDVFKCWGNAYWGALASGSQDTVESPSTSLSDVLLDSGKTVKFVTSGYHHTCILYDDLVTMKCFGRNIFMQLGQVDNLWRGNAPETMIPFIPAINLGTGSLNILRIYTGEMHNCVVFIDYSTKCFGETNVGKLGTVNSDQNQMGSKLQFVEFFTPTQSPTLPTLSPSKAPTKSPTNKPTKSPTVPTKSPTIRPSKSPSAAPVTKSPSAAPVTKSPTKAPAIPSPTRVPSYAPTDAPMTKNPTLVPSTVPTNLPTLFATKNPTLDPTAGPTSNPTYGPTFSPTNVPSTKPTTSPTFSPTTKPSRYPSKSPTDIPTPFPSKNPIVLSTSNPTKKPTINPTQTTIRTKSPTSSPSTVSSTSPTTVTATSTPTKNQIDKTNDTITETNNFASSIGMGVGVPVSLIFLVSVFFILLFKRRSLARKPTACDNDATAITVQRA